MANTSLHYTRRGPRGYMSTQDVPASTAHVLEEADRLGVEWELLDGTRIFRLTYQGAVRYFFERVPQSTEYLGYNCSRYKHVAIELLRRAGLSVPKGYLLYTEEDDEETKRSIFDALTSPLIVRPAVTIRDRHEFPDIDSYEMFQDAVATLASIPYRFVLVEEQFDGEEYEALVSGGEVAVVLRPSPTEGGPPEDVTGQVHKSVLNICVAALESLPGLSFGAVRFVSQDISAPHAAGGQQYVITGVRYSPRLALSDTLNADSTRRAAQAVLHELFPSLRTS